MYSDRQIRLRERMRQLGIGAVAMIPGPNFFYLTGLSFHVSERPILLLLWVEGPPTLICPAFESGKAQDAQFSVQRISYSEDPNSQTIAFREALAGLGAGEPPIALAPFEMRAFEIHLLEEAAPHATFVPGEELLSPLRQIKDEFEIGCTRRAVAIAQRAMEATLPLIQIGMTERELASELVIQLLRAGSEPELPFHPIVATGPNSALPHAVPSDRPLAHGELLLVDWGAAHGGYASDLTRTFALGEIDSEMNAIYQLVQQANAAGREAVQSGQPARIVDRAARQVIESAGYGPQFRHRTGHGLGLQTHEPPYIRSDNEALLESGMIFTVEPGIYVEGAGGVRIEDDVLVTAEGSETLTSLGRGLEVIA
jgi:Xaa-Pro dipeptidase